MSNKNRGYTMTDKKYRRCPYCQSKAFWIKMFNVKTAEGNDVKSYCPICNEDFSLEGVPSCGHSVCNKCFTNFKTISYNEENNDNRYITPPTVRRRYEQSPPPIIQRRNGIRSNEDRSIEDLLTSPMIPSRNRIDFPNLNEDRSIEDLLTPRD